MSEPIDHSSTNTINPMNANLDPADCFRPASYWEEGDPLSAILRNVKGTRRREMIRDFWNNGLLETLDPALLADNTDPELRQFLESLDPTFMGGEYLPDLLPTEVEIARIELESTTADVISIRARRVPGDELIHFRIVDEYDTTFGISPETAAEALTHRELVRLIDTVDGGEWGGLGMCYNLANHESGCDPESLRHFTSVSSDFYPDLFDHYDDIHEQWVTEACRELDGDEEE